jgi:hypothetical protein
LMYLIVPLRKYIFYKSKGDKRATTLPKNNPAGR